MNAIRLTILAAGSVLSSCAALGGGRALSRAPELPSAEGRIRFTRMVGSGTGVDLRVRHLPEPERLDPPAYAYVAWARGSRESPPQNLGFLRRGDDDAGELRALGAQGCSEVFITAEATGDAESPAGRRLLWAACD